MRLMGLIQLCVASKQSWRPGELLSPESIYLSIVNYFNLVIFATHLTTKISLSTLLEVVAIFGRKFLLF
jgi:hypothetical protein